MIAYEFYLREETGEEHLIGILPERRNHRERITENSILNWGWKIIGDNSDPNIFYFVQVEV